MKYWILIIAVSLGVLNVVSARAELVESVKIHADYFVDTDYSIGLDLDANHLITQIYFDQDGQKTFFPLNDLSDCQTIMKVAGVSVVQMKISSHNGTQSAIVDLSYVQNYLTYNHAMMQVSVTYNGATGHYDVVDLRDHHVIHTAYVYTRYNFLHIPIGISSIETE